MSHDRSSTALRATASVGVYAFAIWMLLSAALQVRLLLSGDFGQELFFGAFWVESPHGAGAIRAAYALTYALVGVGLLRMNIYALWGFLGVHVIDACSTVSYCIWGHSVVTSHGKTIASLFSLVWALAWCALVFVWCWVHRKRFRPLHHL